MKLQISLDIRKTLKRCTYQDKRIRINIQLKIPLKSKLDFKGIFVLFRIKQN